MKFLAAVAAVALALTLPAAAAAAPAKSAAKAQRVVLPTHVRPDRYDIRITPDAANLRFTGHVDIAVTVVRATDRIVLNADNLITLARNSGNAAQAVARIDGGTGAAFIPPGSNV